MKCAAFILLLFAAVSAHAQTATPGSGVPLDVATRRAANVGDVRYELSLSIPSALASPLTGSTTIRFTLKDASQPLVLDFETSREHVKSVEVNDKATAFTYVNGHTVVPPTALVSGANSLRIVFDAGDASLNRSADFLYTLFVPARARLALPVFDQPDLKGRWSVTLEHAAALRAESAKRYVKPSLDMLWDLQKTGDIFFPNNWLNATLSDSTKDVADIVRAFLKDLPATYPIACEPSPCKAQTSCFARPTSSPGSLTTARR